MRLLKNSWAVRDAGSGPEKGRLFKPPLRFASLACEGSNCVAYKCLSYN